MNWYGAHQELFVVGGLELQSIANITQKIRKIGANCVRLPLSIQLTRENPIVSPQAIAAVQPSECHTPPGVRAMEILDCVVRVLTENGLMIIMNNHVSLAAWVGAGHPLQQGLWNQPNYSTSDWIQSLHDVALRYTSNPLVVGFVSASLSRSTS